MPDPVITRLDEVTPEWLTDIFSRGGYLIAGQAQSFTMLTEQRELSSNARLKVVYTEDSEGHLPRDLFLKLVKLDMEDEFFGPSEVNYYIRDYVGVPDVPIPRCYDAAYSEAMGCYHILLDDLSKTHLPSYERTPTLEHGFALAEGLAAMHAHWWGSKRLTEAEESISDAHAIHRFVDVARPGVEHILAACADQLEAHWPDTIRALYDHHPRLMAERTQNDSGFTLIHGDTNLSNTLIPIDGHRPIYLIDRQPFDWSLRVWLGVYDLAYTMVLKWETDVRRALEVPILHRYLEYLVRRGVSGYPGDELWNDYRLCAAMGVYVATEWCRGGLNRETMQFWLPMLQRSMIAIDDLYGDTSWLHQ